MDIYQNVSRVGPIGVCPKRQPLTDYARREASKTIQRYQVVMLVNYPGETIRSYSMSQTTENNYPLGKPMPHTNSPEALFCMELWNWIFGRTGVRNSRSKAVTNRVGNVRPRKRSGCGKTGPSPWLYLRPD